MTNTKNKNPINQSSFLEADAITSLIKLEDMSLVIKRKIRLYKNIRIWKNIMIDL
jgi:hypothetical protein